MRLRTRAYLRYKITKSFGDGYTDGYQNALVDVAEMLVDGEDSVWSFLFGMSNPEVFERIKEIYADGHR